MAASTSPATVRFPRMVHKLPAGQSGCVRVEHFRITATDEYAQALADMHEEPFWDRGLKRGRFARLWVGNKMMMSDTRPERISCAEFVERARGHVLIAGLGLGMILWPIARKREVKSITVIERYRGVIDLVGPHVPSGVRIVRADIFRYQPRRQFDVIWFDIWPNIGIGNLLDMRRLHHRYKRWLAPGGWMESWQRSVCEEMARRRDKRLHDVLTSGCIIRCVPRRLAKRIGCHE